MTIETLKSLDKRPFTLKNSHLFRGGHMMICKNTVDKGCGLHCPFFELSIGDKQAGIILTCGTGDLYIPLIKKPRP